MTCALTRRARGRRSSAMTDERSGLPADILDADGTTQRADLDDQHRRLHVERGRRRAARPHRRPRAHRSGWLETLATLERMERSGATGQYYNWYDHRTGAKLTAWPPRPTQPLHPILSSVDNGWLAVGLRIVENSVPEALAPRRRALRRDGLRLLLPARGQPGPVPLPARRPRGARRAATTRSSARAGSSTTSASASGQLPPKAYYGRWRTFPDTCDYACQETQPVGHDADVLRRRRLRGRLPVQRHQLVVPSLGRRMFEALMPDLFVPEERGRRAAGAINHPRTVRAQIFHGLTRPATATGASRPPTSPRAATGIYGVDAIGMDPNGNAVQRGRHARRPRLRGLPGPARAARPAAVGLHQRRRHAARRVPRPALRARARRSREPRAPRPRLPGPVRQVGLPRQRQRPDEGRCRTPTSRSTRG